MSLWKIAWRSIQQRSLASSLTGLSMALGVMLVVAVLLAGVIVDRSFDSANNLGYNLIVGAKGGRLDLLLNTVYYLNRPIENIPWDYYKEFLPASERKDGKPGKLSKYIELAVPVNLGDVLGENGMFRVVGTTPDLFDKLLVPRDENGLPRKDVNLFSEGANFRQDQWESAVIGAEVARTLKKHVGEQIQPQHGIGGDLHNKFTITGVLKRTGTPNDRAAFINMEGFFLIPDHARGHVEEKPAKPGEDHSDEVLKEPLPESAREVTSILVRTVSPEGIPNLPEASAMDLIKPINKDSVAQVIQPALEIRTLNDAIVGPTRYILLGLSVMIVVVAGIGILVSIYTSMAERRHEIAVMRALGARRSTVMSVVLLESVLLALGGGLAGWAVGHMLVWIAGPFITDYTGVSAGTLQFATYELILIPGLILLASLVGYLPALTAYNTDVAKALTASP
jgi:putative ABC transport system permease protein